METIFCKICGSNETAHLFQLKDYRLNRTNEIFNYVKCKNCGVIFQNPRLSPNDMVKHYNQEKIYKTKVHKKGIKKILYEYGLKKRARVIINQKKSGRLLDIGCGNGAFLRYIKQKTDFNVFGTEINKENITVLTQDYGVDVRYGNLAEINFSANFFDVITLWDVIEHLPDPKNIMKEIKRILKPDGFLVIRVPNGNSLDFNLFGKYWAGLDAPRHYYVFTLEALERLLSDTGFKIESQHTNIGSYLNFVISMEFLLNDINVNRKFRELLLQLLRNFIVQIIFYPIFWIKDCIFQGTSLTIVAQSRNNHQPFHD